MQGNRATTLQLASILRVRGNGGLHVGCSISLCRLGGYPSGISFLGFRVYGGMPRIVLQRF